ncbi:hypothetical protein BC830DRAFT_1115501 [Chytriomyces sp. MP71]|nr:hypothetical protein BC830DRAFT_1115501 [Chytriomyces sp. MP71]
MKAPRAQKIITQELLRRRAEHNEGELSTLREVTLHQFDIEKIENLDVYCRHLEILYLQNNQINKIENLHKLKELQYLNLALNNITKIENLEGCESLEKLDLTVNFVSDPLDLESLTENIGLRELFLVGNPITQVEGYREFAITTLPQLKVLDGKEIDKSERILAAQVHESIRERLVKERHDKASINPENKPVTEPESSVLPTDQLDIEGIKTDFKTKPVPFTPETRRQTAREIEAMNGPAREDPAQPKPHKPANRAIARGPDGRVLQRNEGKWAFRQEAVGWTLCLCVEVSKFLDSSWIDVQTEKDFVQVIVKNKVLTVCLEEVVRVGQVLCERSKYTGELVVWMLKEMTPEGLDIEDVVRDIKNRNMVKVETTNKEDSAQGRNRRKERLLDGDHISAVASGAGKIVETNFVPIESGFVSDVEFVDDPDVPPLC